MQPLVISYLRFSTPEQAKGDSTRRQDDAATKYCREHGLTLTDRFSDPGVSAFRGKHLTRQLGDFLALVEKGTVPDGSTLLVEELDRLSRQSPEEALTLFLNIIRAGVKVVTLNTGEVFERGKIQMQNLLLAVFKFCSAHDESAKKSDRVGKAWANKRSEIGKKPLTSMLPHWLKMRDGAIRVDEPKAVLVRRIFKLALNGQGLSQITKSLNAETPGFARSKFWHRSYVFKILHSRAVFGEFQPHRVIIENGKRRREPEGDPIPNYFPLIVSERDYWAVQKALKSRKTASGPQTSFVNILAGLLYCDDGSSIQIQNKGYGRRYVSSGALLGIKGHSPYVGFPVIALEQAILQTLARPGLYTDSSKSDELQVEIAAVEGQLVGTATKINAVQNSLLNGGATTESVLGLLDKLDAQKRAQKRRLDDLKMTKATASNDDAVSDYFEFMERQGKGELSKDERLRVRAILVRIVERIDCHFTRQHHDYWCEASILLKSGQTINMTVGARPIDQGSYEATVGDDTSIDDLPPVKTVEREDAKRWRDAPATHKQKVRLKELGWTYGQMEKMTAGEASDALELERGKHLGKK